MRLRAALATLALGATIGVGGTAVAQATNPHMTGVTPADQTVVSGCVIRFLPEDGGMPSTHANGAHRCSGVNKVSVDQHGQVVLHQTISDTKRYPILYVQAQADESLVTRGVTAGVSGGTGTSRIRLYDSKLGRQLLMTNAADRARITCSTCNLWVGFVHIDRGAGAS